MHRMERDLPHSGCPHQQTHAAMKYSSFHPESVQSPSHRFLTSATRLMAQILLFLGAVYLLTGCVGAQSVSNESTFTISALETALQDEGVFVMPRSGANPGIPADQSSRLVLNSSEVLNVFEFDSSRRASDQAHSFAGSNPRNEVYLKDRVVAIRQGRGDTGLSATLRTILGEAL